MSDQQTATADSCASRVRAPYAAAARQAAAGTQASDSGCSCGQPVEEPGIGAELYTAADRDALPDAAVLASLGCGNPAAVAELHQGETVLDLGSGGGIDVLLSARRVGPTGKAWARSATPTTTPSPRASSPPWSANCWTAASLSPHPGPHRGLRLPGRLLQPRRRHSTLGCLSPVEHERRHPTGHIIA